MILPNSVKKIGIVSPSWNGPGLFPFVFEKGVSEIKKTFGKEVVYSTHCISKDLPSFQERANDIHEMFSNDEVDIIIASIGGSDSVNIIPLLDSRLIEEKAKGKVFIGYSDATTLLLYLNNLGVSTIHGPTVMSGFAEMSGITEELRTHIQSILNFREKEYIYPFFKSSVDKNNPWESEELFMKGKTVYDNVNTWHLIQGGVVTGEMYGGNLETINTILTTSGIGDIFKNWEDSILFLETSEEKPSLDYLKSFFRKPEIKNLILKNKAVVMGYLSYYSEIEKVAIRNLLKEIIVDEYLFTGTLVTDIQVGHSRPQWLIVEGGLYTINPLEETLILHR